MVEAPRSRAWVPVLVLYLLALAARLAFVATAPYGDEAHHYFVARHFGQPPSNVVGQQDTHWLFWWRPMFSILLVPGASISFTAFRVDYMLQTAALAPLAYLWARQRQVRLGLAAGLGVLLAVHPFFLVWGVRAFPDELMAVYFVLGLWLWERGSTYAGASSFLVAEWVKETALVGIAVLLADLLLRSVRRERGAVVLPMQTRQLLLVVLLLLSWLPHWFAEAIGGKPPGWSRGDTLAPLFEGVFLTIWALPFVVAALIPRRSRLPALLACSYFAFYGAYHVLRGGKVEDWYLILPATLGLCALAVFADHMFDPLSAHVPSTRWAGRGAVAVILAAVLVQVIVPGAVAAKTDALHPLSRMEVDSLGQTVHHEFGRDRDLWRAVDAVPPRAWTNVLAVDMGWFNVLYPLSDRAGSVASGYTEGVRSDPERWSDLIEHVANSTIVQVEPFPMNRAVRDVYAGCESFVSSGYVVIEGQSCAGRAPDLRAAFARELAASGLAPTQST